jgi:hypothetical protein
MKVILFASHDRGGANVIAGLLRNSIWLRRQHLLLLIEGPALSVLESLNCGIVRIHCLPDTKVLKPDLVVCGTSFQAKLEIDVTRWANEQFIPSASLIDSWVNLAIRYWDPRARCYVLPTLITVIDKGCRDRLLDELGDRAPIIAVSGQPYLQQLVKRKYEKTLSVRSKLPRILFCSEPIQQVYNQFGELGYDQFSVFDQLVRLFESKKCCVTIEIKLHPSEDPSSWLSLLDSYRCVGSVVIERTEGELHSAIARSDLVVGLVSMALLEAVLAGKPTYSCQFARKQRLAEGLTQYMTICESVHDFWQCFQTRQVSNATPLGLLAAVENSVERVEGALAMLAEGSPECERSVLPDGCLDLLSKFDQLRTVGLSR